MESVVVGSIISAMATGVGALPILFFKNLTHRWRDILLAYTAGIMMCASTFNLIPQALHISNVTTLMIGIILGLVVLTVLEKSIPHTDLDHNIAGTHLDTKAVLIITAMTLHNIPEGLSVGVSYASEHHEMGGLIAFAIGLQNAPEGLLVALFLVNQKIGRFKAFLLATLTGSIEIIASLGGFYLAHIVTGLVPYGLAFAAGAMLFIVYKELIPESHGDGHATSSTYAFVAGLLTMIVMTEKFA